MGLLGGPLCVFEYHSHGQIDGQDVDSKSRTIDYATMRSFSLRRRVKIGKKKCNRTHEHTNTRTDNCLLFDVAGVTPAVDARSYNLINSLEPATVARLIRYHSGRYAFNRGGRAPRL
jgi:hypothetical protein